MPDEMSLLNNPLINLMKVDSIYRFTDFDDSVYKQTVKLIATPLIESKVKLKNDCHET